MDKQQNVYARHLRAQAQRDTIHSNRRTESLPNDVRPIVDGHPKRWQCREILTREKLDMHLIFYISSELHRYNIGI